MSVTYIHRHPDRPEHTHASAVEASECDGWLDFVHQVKLDLLGEYSRHERNSLPVGVELEAEVHRRWWTVHEHRARPDDLPEPGDRCKDCGVDITWVGPSLDDWVHAFGHACDYTIAYGLPWTEICGQPAVGKWHEGDDEWFCAQHITPEGR